MNLIPFRRKNKDSDQVIHPSVVANPAEVEYVLKTGDKECKIVFRSGRFVVVHQSVGVVLSRLEKYRKTFK